MHTPKICEQCGESYLPAYNVSAAGFAKRRYCSNVCRYAAATGTPQPKNAGPRQSLVDQFWPKVDVCEPDDCWTWTGAIWKQGYGKLVRCGKYLKAHRVSYEINAGPIPEGLSVLHTCDNPPCCNPAHLWVGTNGDNNRDRQAKGRSRGGAVGNRGLSTAELNGRALITFAQVCEIRTRYAAGESQAMLARDYPVKAGAIGRIVRGETWRK